MDKNLKKVKLRILLVTICIIVAGVLFAVI